MYEHWDKADRNRLEIKARIMLPSSLSAAQRACWATIFALLISIRLLTPHGFMPVWNAVRIEVRICDDAGAALGAATHDKHGKKGEAKHRPPCPFAAASAETFLSLPAPAAPLPPTLGPVAVPDLRLSTITFRRKIERPPSRAPPGLA